MRLVLASRSPRRRELLTRLGLEPEFVAPGVEELRSGLDPPDLVLENARRKADAGLALVAKGGSAADAVVLGCDTEVFLDGQALGQPADRAGAEAALRALGGRTHEVLSGVCLAWAGGERREAVARSLVTFAEPPEALIARYLDSGEWRGRAGGYAVQGLGSMFVVRLEGDFSNVVGLPVATLAGLVPELLDPASG